MCVTVTVISRVLALANNHISRHRVFWFVIYYTLAITKLQGRKENGNES